MVERARPRGSGQADAEWLVTNGLGGFASGPVTGGPTRRYHGLLVAALPNPLGRVVMLGHLVASARTADGRWVDLSGDEATPCLEDFRLEDGLPVWRFTIGENVLERRLVMPHGQNTTRARFRLVKGDEAIMLRLRPMMNARSLERPVGASPAGPYRLTVVNDRYEFTPPLEHDFPPLRLRLTGNEATFTVAGSAVEDYYYSFEAARGYAARGDLWTPGHFTACLTPDQPVDLVASTEPWEIMLALNADDVLGAERDRRARLLAIARAAAKTGVGAELVLAADQFIITPIGRLPDVARARAAGDELRTIIAGYHWFTDWGRDTMIALEGLTLTTGRDHEAADILAMFAQHVRDGLIPNYFPEAGHDGVYHTADATLWFFHALDRYLTCTNDRHLLRRLLPILRDIVAHHQRGARFNIRVDPADGLLTQGAEGYQLTWMDAKVDDWVVTPRRGKAVEINALWHNALCLLAGWLAEEEDETAARSIRQQAEQARASFNARFWHAEGGYLYDVIDGPDGDDPACRPNQVFAIALPHPVLDKERWEPVMEVVRERLLTPVGLRSLAPGHPDYVARYQGDLRARDAAYHQGAVWPWLIGPFVDAWLKVYPDDLAGARALLTGLAEHLGQAGRGSVSEIFDAEPPFTPRGCIAQAWSVAELLRCWVRTAGAG